MSLGRYRDFKLEWVHFFIFLTAFTFMVFLYGVILRMRLNNQKSRQKQMPRKKLPLQSFQMSSQMFGLLLHEARRRLELLRSLIPEDAGEGDIGCKQTDIDDGIGQTIHFTTSVSKSYVVLEKALQVQRPGFRQPYYRSIRHHMAFLKKQFVGLKFENEFRMNLIIISEELIKEYFETYELARFGNHKFNSEEFKRLSSVIQQLYNQICPRLMND